MRTVLITDDRDATDCDFEVDEGGGFAVLVDGRQVGQIGGELTLESVCHFLSTLSAFADGATSVPLRQAADSVVIDRVPKSGVTVTVHFGPHRDESAAAFFRYECAGARYTEVKPTCADRVDLGAWRATRGADDPYPAPMFYSWRVRAEYAAPPVTEVFRHPEPGRPADAAPEESWSLAEGDDSIEPDVETVARRVCESDREHWMKPRDAGGIARDLFLLDEHGRWEYHCQSYEGTWLRHGPTMSDREAHEFGQSLRGVPRG